MSSLQMNANCVRDKRYNMKIKVYTKGGCPFCTSAKEWLDERSLEYEVIDVSDDTERAKVYEETGMKSVPIIFFGDDMIGGFSELKVIGDSRLVESWTTLDPSLVYKPMLFPGFVEIAKDHERMHWTEDEAELSEDVNDWKGGKTTTAEQMFIMKILTLFTQSDVAVADNYIDQFLPKFKNNQVRQMLMSFASRECFSDDTEVLTENGWRLFKDVLPDEKVAQWDMEHNNISFDVPTERVSRHYTGKMHSYNSKCTSILVTPKHDLVLINPHTSKVTKQQSESGVWGRNFLYPNSSTTMNVSEVDEKTLILDRILCAVAADASIDAICPWNIENRPNSRKCSFNLTKERKKERLVELIEKFVELGGNDLIGTSDKLSGSTVFRWNIPEHVDMKTIKNYGWLGENLADIPLARMLTVMDEIRYWDCTKTSDEGFQFFSSNEEAVDRISQISVLSGYRANVSVARTIEQTLKSRLPTGNYPKTAKTAYRVGLIPRSKTVYPRRKEIDYDGMVYCLTMPKGTLVCRRDGKSFISGNCTHQRAYALLNETLNFPNSFYSEFLSYKEMADKVEAMQSANPNTQKGLALCLARSVFNEGVMLFASFAMLLNFTRFNKMKGMGQIVDWSIKDESVHATGLAQLFRVYCEERPRIVNDAFKKEIYEMARQTVELEDAFVDLAFDHSGDAIEGLTRQEIKDYIRYITDKRLVSLGLKENYNIEENPLPWIDSIVGGIHKQNFFEGRST